MRYLCNAMTTGARRPLWRPVTFVVLGVAMVATLLLATATPHLHLGRDPGFFNEEHDLSLFVAASTHAPLPDGLPVIVLGGVVAHAFVVLPRPPASHPIRLADPRAPPLA